MALTLYLQKFRELNTLRLNGHNKPHKVCMLLAVIELIEIGIINQNIIEFSDTLKLGISG
ncbi:hypothetical protein JAO78_016630 [Alishewanella sp. 16-MA]|uniref:Uncharacterized protein n=1 Tax=Alishewanella maricola TaxID=2795740 RepID=A0ABS8C7W4_9ALTE|nr:hypothetical protein [Alishewanella maricola]MCB5228429.1 hypothetical protein [Alishewanella maricola]